VWWEGLGLDIATRRRGEGHPKKGSGGPVGQKPNPPYSPQHGKKLGKSMPEPSTKTSDPSHELTGVLEAGKFGKTRGIAIPATTREHNTTEEY